MIIYVKEIAFQIAFCNYSLGEDEQFCVNHVKKKFSKVFNKLPTFIQSPLN